MIIIINVYIVILMENLINKLNNFANKNSFKSVKHMFSNDALVDMGYLKLNANNDYEWVNKKYPTKDAWLQGGNLADDLKLLLEIQQSRFQKLTNGKLINSDNKEQLDYLLITKGANGAFEFLEKNIKKINTLTKNIVIKSASSLESVGEISNVSNSKVNSIIDDNALISAKIFKFDADSITKKYQNTNLKVPHSNNNEGNNVLDEKPNSSNSTQITLLSGSYKSRNLTSVAHDINIKNTSNHSFLDSKLLLKLDADVNFSQVQKYDSDTGKNKTFLPMQFNDITGDWQKINGKLSAKINNDNFITFSSEFANTDIGNQTNLYIGLDKNLKNSNLSFGLKLPSKIENDFTTLNTKTGVYAGVSKDVDFAEKKISIGLSFEAQKALYNGININNFSKVANFNYESEKSNFNIMLKSSTPLSYGFVANKFSEFSLNYEKLLNKSTNLALSYNNYTAPNINIDIYSAALDFSTNRLNYNIASSLTNLSVSEPENTNGLGEVSKQNLLQLGVTISPNSSGIWKNTSFNASVIKPLVNDGNQPFQPARVSFSKSF